MTRLCHFQDHVTSNHTAKREPARRDVTVMGKKDGGKSTKKSGMLFGIIFVHEVA